MRWILLSGPPGVHAGDQCSGDMCRTECQLEVTAGDHAGDGEYCPGLLSTRGDGVLMLSNPIAGPVGMTAAREPRGQKAAVHHGRAGEPTTQATPTSARG